MGVFFIGGLLHSAYADDDTNQNILKQGLLGAGVGAPGNFDERRAGRRQTGGGHFWAFVCAGGRRVGILRRCDGLVRDVLRFEKVGAARRFGPPVGSWPGGDPGLGGHGAGADRSGDIDFLGGGGFPGGGPQ